MQGARPADARAPALGRQPAEGRARARVRRRAARARDRGVADARARRRRDRDRARATSARPPRDGVAILLISEDLDEILALADRVVVMYEGAARRRGRRGARPTVERDRAADGRRARRVMTVRIERRLDAAALAAVAVPIGSLVRRVPPRSRSCSSRPATTRGRRTAAVRRRLRGGRRAHADARSSATPLVFTGLCAAAAFRMNLFNIGGEGQLYFGAIGAAAAGAATSPGQPAPSLIAAMVRRRARRAAPPGRSIPGVLRAFLSTNEIITSLMLNYVAGADPQLPDLRQPLVLARHVVARGGGLPAGEDAAGRGELADVVGIGASSSRSASLARRRRRALLWVALLAHALRLRGAGDRRLAAGGALRRACGRAGRSSP